MLKKDIRAYFEIIRIYVYIFNKRKTVCKRNNFQNPVLLNVNIVYSCEDEYIH